MTMVAFTPNTAPATSAAAVAFLLLLLAVAAGFDTWLALAPTGSHTNRRRLQRLQPKRSYWCGPAPKRWRQARCLSLGVVVAALVAVAAVVVVVEFGTAADRAA